MIEELIDTMLGWTSLPHRQSRLHNNVSINQVAAAIFVIIAFSGCKKQIKLYELVPSSQSHVTFVNEVKEDDKLYNVESYMNIYTGAGVAAADINNDGLVDLYFSGNQQSGKLYLNKGDFKFEDITESAGVQTKSWCTGVTMVDINQDGFMDIYINISGSPRYGKMENLLFINDGHLHFKESAQLYGINEKRKTMNSSFIDYDKDGDLDLFLITNPADSSSKNVNALRYNQPHEDSLEADILYRNNGNNTFTDISKEAGIVKEGYSLGASVTDINGDGWPDIYVCNDFIANDILYINNRDGTFTDRLKDFMKHTSMASMGADIADFNNDGLPDIFTLDMLPEDNFRRKMLISNPNFDWYKMSNASGYLPQYTRNNLQLNNGDSSFSEIGFLAGVSSTDWSWSALWGDYDNDGDKDLMVTNGFFRDLGNRDYIVNQSRDRSFSGQDLRTAAERLQQVRSLESVPLQNYIFKNNDNLSFTKTSDDWGLKEKGFSNGTCYADLDNDGDLELIINCFNGEARIYQNNAEKLNSNKSLVISLKGAKPNLQGVGAKVWLYANDSMQFQELSPYRGYESSMDYRLFFGLGTKAIVDSMLIVWPDGKEQKLLNVKAGNLELKYIDAKARVVIQEIKNAPLFFSAITDTIALNYQHKEDQDFNDFNIQVLIPHTFSTDGPGIAVGDINGDALDDFFIGAASGSEGKFFTQTIDGSFNSFNLPLDKISEDLGVLFFDADDDKDLDLYVVSGGTQTEANSQSQQDRLYINDGNGNFSAANDALPDTKASGSCVIAADYDKDGDMDLFVGGRVIPGSYPLAPRSYLLRNDTRAGTAIKFTDITSVVAPELVKPGMVSAALWTDYDNDGLSDILVTGEFMALQFYHNDGKKFSLANSVSDLDSNAGWWNNVVAGDFDEDGDIDYIAGNLGLNTPLKASLSQPLCVNAKDFNNDGRIDPVLCFYQNNKNYIYPTRDELLKQMVFLRNRFYTYSDYAKLSFEESFTEEERKGMLVLKAACFESSYFENKGKGKFIRRALPNLTQTAPIFGMLCEDFNDDGHLDILLTGNSYATETSIGRYDAMNGLILIGDGKGNFIVRNAANSGFKSDKDAKGMASLFLNSGSELVLIANNNDKLKALNVNSSSTRVYQFKPGVQTVTVELRNGHSYKKEIYFGSSYLSQSTQKFRINRYIKALTINYLSGKQEKVEFSEE